MLRIRRVLCAPMPVGIRRLCAARAARCARLCCAYGAYALREPRGLFGAAYGAYALREPLYLGRAYAAHTPRVVRAVCLC